MADFAGIPFTTDRPLGHVSFMEYFRAVSDGVRAADGRGARVIRLEIRKGRLIVYSSDGLTIEYVVRPCACCPLGKRMTCPDCGETSGVDALDATETSHRGEGSR
jgi:hypothetical protein